MKRNKYGFKKFICKLEGKNPPRNFCTLPPVIILNLQSLESYLKTKESAHLLRAFIWDGTPQGGDYWRSIYQKHTESTEEDFKFAMYLLQPHLHTIVERYLKVSLTEWEIPNEN